MGCLKNQESSKPQNSGFVLLERGCGVLRPFRHRFATPVNSASGSLHRSIARPPQSKRRIVSFIGGRVSEETHVVTTTYEIDGGGLRTFVQKYPMLDATWLRPRAQTNAHSREPAKVDRLLIPLRLFQSNRNSIARRHSSNATDAFGNNLTKPSLISGAPTSGLRRQATGTSA